MVLPFAVYGISRFFDFDHFQPVVRYPKPNFKSRIPETVYPLGVVLISGARVLGQKCFQSCPLAFGYFLQKFGREVYFY